MISIFRKASSSILYPSLSAYFPSFLYVPFSLPDNSTEGPILDFFNFFSVVVHRTTQEHTGTGGGTATQ